MNITDDVKKVVVGVATSAVIGFFSAFVGIHTQTTALEQQVRELKDTQNRNATLAKDVENMRIKVFSLVDTQIRHETSLTKLADNIAATREVSIRSLETLENIAKSQDSLVKVAASLQITVTKLETLVTMKSGAAHASN